MLSSYFLPRDLHPAAWWVWALGLAAASSRTTNPLLLATIIAVVCFVVMARRSDAPWAMAFRLYLYLAAFVVALRMVFRVVFGGGEGSTVLLDLPAITLPQWAAGVSLFGPVSVESLLSGLYDGLRLAAMIICVGGANALANPKRLLKSLPPALYEVGTAAVVALSVFPQLAESVQRVGRARRLRGDLGRGRRALRAIVVPVLEDAFDRSLMLAASMDSRGYGRAGRIDARTRLVTGTLLIAGLVGLCVGVYATLDTTMPRILAAPALVVGSTVSCAGLVLAGRRVERTRYRPDRWLLAEVVTAASGVTVAVLYLATVRFDPSDLAPSTVGLGPPTLAWAPLLGALVGLVPAWLTPPPVLASTGTAVVPAERSGVTA